MSRKNRKYKFSIYLIKEECNSIYEVVNNPQNLECLSFKLQDNTEYTLFVKKTTPKTPSWISFFKEYLSSELNKIFNLNNSAVLIFSYEDRYFAFSFGYGRSLINQAYIEELFGLRIALNTIQREKLKSIDIKSIDTVTRHSRIQTSQAGSVDTFGMDIDKDILNAVTGECKEEILGKTISGADALYIGLPITVNELPELAEKLLEKYNDKSYQQEFPWVDNVREVKDKLKIEELNKRLLSDIHNKYFEKIYLAIPEIIDWGNTEGFKYKESDKVKEDIDIEGLLQDHADFSDIDIELLKGKSVLCVGKDNEEIIYKWTAYKCLNYEFIDESDTFLLTGGKWFKIDNGFISHVNNEISEIPDYNKYRFPDYIVKNEDEYIEEIKKRNDNNFFLMHGENIPYGGGRSSIEFCDIIINAIDFIHIKRFRGSSSLSHLFLQGHNSAYIFYSDKLFREKVNQKLPNQFKIPDIDNIDPSKYEIVFAIISTSPSIHIKDILPFFSKISLMQVYRRLKLYKFKISLIKISVGNLENV
jgi:uncharacterized protein (TIGR04141 family)